MGWTNEVLLRASPPMLKVRGSAAFRAESRPFMLTPPQKIWSNRADNAEEITFSYIIHSEG